jgi:hypothetical protein
MAAAATWIEQPGAQQRAEGRGRVDAEECHDRSRGRIGMLGGQTRPEPQLLAQRVRHVIDGGDDRAAHGTWCASLLVLEAAESGFGLGAREAGLRASVPNWTDEPVELAPVEANREIWLATIAHGEEIADPDVQCVSTLASTCGVGAAPLLLSPGSASAPVEALRCRFPCEAGV